jgi:hypothetical protein
MDISHHLQFRRNIFPRDEIDKAEAMDQDIQSKVADGRSVL